MTYTHIAYVDEAGDEGFGKLRNPDRGGQSQWLLLGAVIVRAHSDPLLPRWRDEILYRFSASKIKDLHFRNLKHDQKVVVCQELATKEIFYCITLSNKATLPGSKWAELFKRPGHLYNYLTRWLLERTTTFCATDAIDQRIRPRLKVVFSRRGGTNYQAMHDYMTLMRDDREKIRPVRSINWNAFSPDDIVVENHSKWAGLQIADAVTSSVFNAVEPNIYGNTERRYADLIRSKAIAVNGYTLNCGITPVPSLTQCNATGDALTFLRSFVSQQK